MDQKSDDLEKKQADPLAEYMDVDDTLEDTLYARHAELKSFEDLEKQRGTSIPALFNQLYKFVQNPSSVSVETYKRMVDTDDTIGSGFDFLTACLSARIGRYTHPSKEITKFVNDSLEGIEGGFSGGVKQILSAAWAGFSASEIVWQNSDKGFVPKKLITLPPTTVLFETERTGELTPDGILQYQRNYNPFLSTGGGFLGMQGAGGLGLGFLGRDAGRPDPFAKLGDFPFPLRTANSFNFLCIRIPVQKCIHFPFSAQGSPGNPYGRSLARRIYKYYVVKDAILQMMTIALDRKGTPLTIVYADPNAMIEKETSGDAQQSVRGNKGRGERADEAARRAFQNVHNDSTIILPGKKGEMYDHDFLPQASNVSDFVQAMDFCNKSMLRGLLLPSLIFGNGDGTGSYSLGQEHAKTFDKICDATNQPLESCLLNQYVKQIMAYNFPRSAWEKDGVGSFSKKTLSRDEIEKEMDVFEKGINAGIIDQADLNDLNQMRETINFDPREKPIEKPMPVLGGGFGDALGGSEPGSTPGAKADKEARAEGQKKEGGEGDAGSKAEEAKTPEKKELTRLQKLIDSIARLIGLRA